MNGVEKGWLRCTLRWLYVPLSVLDCVAVSSVVMSGNREVKMSTSRCIVVDVGRDSPGMVADLISHYWLMNHDELDQTNAQMVVCIVVTVITREFSCS